MSFEREVRFAREVCLGHDAEHLTSLAAKRHTSLVSEANIFTCPAGQTSLKGNDHAGIKTSFANSRFRLCKHTSHADLIHQYGEEKPKRRLTDRYLEMFDVESVHFEFWNALDELVSHSEIVIDRPKGSVHPRFPGFIYRVDYGYLKNTTSSQEASR